MKRLTEAEPTHQICSREVKKKHALGPVVMFRVSLIYDGEASVGILRLESLRSALRFRVPLGDGGGELEVVR